ncbi:MAG: outer membrane protein assembly factor [Gemmatimonadaceae bacterium]
MLGRRRRFFPSGVILAALAVLPACALGQDVGCSDERGGLGELEVRRVTFTGNYRFRDSELANSIVTSPSSWFRRVLRLPMGSRHCLDTLEFQRDALRLRLYYRVRGYWKTTIEPSVSALGPGVVTVRFSITEGPPVILSSLGIQGLDTVQNGAALKRLLHPLAGAVFDRLRLRTVIDTVVTRLRNSGYAEAEEPLSNSEVDTVANQASLELTFLPGRIARIDTILFNIEPNQIDNRVEIGPTALRRILSFEEGDVFSERALFRSQRDLYQLEAYRHVEIRLVPPDSAPGGDSLRTVLVRLSEADLKTVRVGVGWATLDCFRTQGLYTDRNFLGGARRLEISARISKIGIGQPLSGAKTLCNPIRDDPFSKKLNYYTGLTFRPPTFFGPRNVPSFTVYSERRSEFQAYLRRTTFGGIASITREQRPRTPVTLSYQVEYGRTEADTAVFCSVFDVCNLEDVGKLQEASSLQALSLAIARDRTDNAYNPSRGSVSRVEVRHAMAGLGASESVRFNKGFGEASVYRAVGRSSVLAARLQGGAILAQGSLKGASDFVPPQERLYGGGPNSVRGFAQNRLGPVVYIVSGFDSVTTDSGGTIFVASPDSVSRIGIRRESPTGGNALVAGNLELRTRGPILRDILQMAFFVDFGHVWNRTDEFLTLSDIKVTPGAGLRVDSPFGPLRVDIGYNRYPKPSGAAYFVGSLQEGDRPVLLCVSPGNDFSRGVVRPGEPCPATFAPKQGSTFFDRLTFHASIGQAF